MFQAIEKKMTHDFDAKGDTLFVGIEIRTVQRSCGRTFWAFYTQEEIETWNFLTKKGEVFSNHLGF
jgi:hypothetical protein